MKIIVGILILICLTLSVSLAQIDKKGNKSVNSLKKPVKMKIDQSNVPKYREEFFVLIENESIKHGAYKKISQSMYTKGEIMEEGQYDAGKKVGLWKFGIRQLGSSQGQYFNDRKIGIWNYHNANKKLNHKYDHSNNLVLFKSEWINQCDCVVIDNERETRIKPDNLPLFVGGEIEMYYHLFDLITPTHEVITQRKSGVVLIRVIIDEKGKIEVKDVYQGLEPNFDTVVLRGMKTIPNEFLPAKKDNKPVKVRCYFPYAFKSS